MAAPGDPTDLTFSLLIQLLRLLETDLLVTGSRRNVSGNRGGCDPPQPLFGCGLLRY